MAEVCVNSRYTGADCNISSLPGRLASINRPIHHPGVLPLTCVSEASEGNKWWREGINQRQGEKASAPLTGPVKSRDGTWWKGLAQVQNRDGSSLSGGAWLSVSQVSSRGVCGFCEGAKSRWAGKESRGLVEGEETATFVFMLVRREQVETLVIIRGWDVTVSNGSSCACQCGDCLFSNCPTWLPLTVEIYSSC